MLYIQSTKTTCTRWNYLAWTFETATGSIYATEAILALYSLYHPDFVPSNYHYFIAYLGVTWTSCSMILFGQQALTRIANTCAILCLSFWFISLMIVAIMPATKNGYGNNHFVWAEWNNQTGYSSNGLVFCLGLLNGAFAIGTPHGCTHSRSSLTTDYPDRTLIKQWRRKSPTLNVISQKA